MGDGRTNDLIRGWSLPVDILMKKLVFFIL